MDKFVIVLNSAQKIEKFPSVRLYEVIHHLSVKLYPKNIKDISTWESMIQEWNLDKYLINTLYTCDCQNKKDQLVISNSKNSLTICSVCIPLFPKINSLYKSIAKVVKYILSKKHTEFPEISGDIIDFFNLTEEDFNLISKKPLDLTLEQCDHVYQLFTKIGDYHYKNKEYQKTLTCFFQKLQHQIEEQSKIMDPEKIYQTVANILSELHICSNCSYLNECQTCFFQNNHLIPSINILTNKQKEILWKLYLQIFNEPSHVSGFYGYAGTGKTTLIKFILQIDHLKNRFILKQLKILFNITDYQPSSVSECITMAMNNANINKTLYEILNTDKIVVLAAPTNKALDVIREKVGEIQKFVLTNNTTGNLNGLEIKFLTVAKLLNYQRHYDASHNINFKRGLSYTNIFNQYELMIIDECSMLGKENIEDIKLDIKNITQNGKGYLIFTGDKAQLPPPKENKSQVFDMQTNKLELTTIMRTDQIKIKQLSNFIRKWLFNLIQEKNLRNQLLKHQCEYIKFFSKSEDFINEYCKKPSSIILVWTNETRKKYNTIIREKLFKKQTKKKFMPGEHLIFNSYYKLKKPSEKIFYSSMPIIISEIRVINNFKCLLFDTEIMMEKLKLRMPHSTAVQELIIPEKYKMANQYVENFVERFNNSIENEFKVWQIYFIYKGKKEKEPLYAIYYPKKFQKEIDQYRKYIKEYFNPDMTNFSHPFLKEIIREIVIEEFDEKFEQPFADIDYGYAMTVDKSQGSTFESVFIDAPDILDTKKYPFLDLNVAKRRFYTGITRSSKEINILL